MTGTVYTGVYVTGIVLSNATTQNPATIAASGYVSNIGTAASYNGDAIYGKPGTAWSIDNNGTIVANSSSASSVGIDLKSGGSVTNGSGGTIAGEYAGIRIAGTAGTVANLGTITGVLGSGVYLQAGGSVTNGHSGSSAGRIFRSGSAFSVFGIEIRGAAGTVANFGTITATATFGDAVFLFAGGSVTNGQSGSSAGLISGSSLGVAIKGGAGTVANFATIAGSGTEGVALDAGGGVTNGQSGSSAALISGVLYGVSVRGGLGTVTNFGTITGTGTSGTGVFLYAGGSVTNGQSSSIDASIGGGFNGVEVDGASGAVTNFGIITGTNAGVILAAGGSVTVNRYALISGGGGIGIFGGAGTVISAGAISGSGGTAIQFGSDNDTLILDPTATFAGKVDGGTGSNTLELRAGTTTGALNALGTGFVSFGHVVVDPGANWTVAAASLAPGQVVAGSGGANQLVFQTAGTIDLSGVSGFPTIVLAGLGANSTGLGNVNFVGLTTSTITVTGGDFGNAVNASALTGVNRVVATGGIRNDQLTGGAGNDTLSGGGGDDTLTGNSGNDALNGNAGNDTLNGNIGNDTLNGDTGNDTLNGGLGADPMIGGTGNDTYIVDNAGDAVTENLGEGTDTVKTSLATYTLGANVENLTFTGSGSFAGTGNTLANIITGGAGNDTLAGGAGNDQLHGGAGQDSFRFDSVLNAATNVDRVFDFTSIEHIQLKQAVFAAAGGLGTLASGAFFIGAGAHDASDRIIYHSFIGALGYDPDGNGGAAETKFATLSAGLALTNSNFTIVA